VTTATVRRDGRLLRVDAERLVPGDMVVLEPGDLVPADGRLWTSASLEVQESALTGEAVPAAKSTEADVDDDAALGDRATAVFMNTWITRGRAEVLVTATGMATEIARIAGMLHAARPGPTPLQRQTDASSRTRALVAGAVIVLVFAIGMARGRDFGDLFLSAVSLAVAAIPEGLPAVVAFTLAMGTARMARRGAIVKRLASVETLGSASQICTDKTGTLTLNQMTARDVAVGGRQFTTSGEGYFPDGRILAADGCPAPRSLREALAGMALCSDAVIRDGTLVGDPTEGALVVLAEKGGVDVAELRRQRPRHLEIPFDSGHKFMATFHDWIDATGREVVRCFVKGAPDVLADRAQRYHDGTQIAPFDPPARDRYEQANCALAEQGMRVMAVGAQDFPAGEFEPPQDPKDLLDSVVLLALVGLVDPPRPEARAAIAECRAAGIRVRMITGEPPRPSQGSWASLGRP
jgi:P-type Ca2+ transporter type 2C